MLRPLRVLEGDIDLIVHGNPHHTAEPPAGHALGSLPDAANRLAEERSRARVDTTKAMHSAHSRSQRRGARLGAILRDLSEAVIVCTQQHRVVLYNDSASELFAGVGKLGIGRTLTTVLQPAALRGALTELNRRHRSGGDLRGVVTVSASYSALPVNRYPGACAWWSSTMARHSALGDSVTTAEVFVKMIDVLEARGIRNLGQALEAADRVQEIKRLQERF